MAAEILKRDQNFVTVLAGVTNDSDQDVTMLRVDPITKRLLVSASATGIGTVTDFSAGNLSPLFTTSVATSTTTPALSFALSNAGANTYFGNATGILGAPSYTSAGALTKTDDTNVTLTLGGSPTTALLAATSLTLGWTGTLAVSRGGTGTGTTFTQGSIVFAGASGVYTQDNANFFWDNTNIQLKIGSNSIVNGNSLNPIAVAKTSTSYLATYIQNLSSGTAASTDLIIGNNADDGTVSTGTYLDMGINSSGYTGTGLTNGPGDAYIFNNLEDLVIGTGTAGKNVIIGTNIFGGTAASKTRATFTDTGLQMMNGSASAPSVSGTGATTTGFYWAATPSILTAIAGVNRLTHSATTWSLNSSNGGTTDIGGTSQYIDLSGTIIAGGATFQGIRTTTLIWDMQVSRTTSMGINNANTIGGSTGSLTLTTMSANRSVNTLTGSVGITITTSNAFEAREFNNGSSGTVVVTNNYGFNASQNMTTGATINAAFHSINSANATRWNLYLEGTAQNWLAGNLGIGSTTSTPTAKLHISAGSTAASTAPIKLTSGSLMTAPEVGAIEFLTDAYYATITTGTTRKTLAFLESPSFTTPNIGAATGTSLITTGKITSGVLDTMVVNGATVTANFAANSDTLAVYESNTASATAGSGGAFYAARSRGTIGSPSVVSNGDTLGVYFAVGHDGTDFALGGSMSFIVDGTPGANDMPTKWVLALSPDGTQVPVTAISVASTGITTFSNGVVLAAGTTTLTPLKNVAGTLNTTAVAGGHEYDGVAFYSSPVASARGVSPSIMGSYLSSDFTLQNASGVQSAFGTGQDVWTLEASTTYRFKGIYYLSTGTTSHSLALAFALAGGASITSMKYKAIGQKGTVNNNATAQATAYVDQVASTVIIPAAASSDAWIEFEGIIRMNAGGTVTPQIAFSADPTGTCLMLTNSFIEFYPIGSNTVTNIGNVA